MSKNNLTESDVDEYVIVWQDMDFKYHRMTGSRVFRGYDAAESINRTLADKRTEVMRLRDYNYLQQQLKEDTMTNSQKEKLVEKIACVIDEAFGARVVNDGDLDPIYELIEGVKRRNNNN